MKKNLLLTLVVCAVNNVFAYDAFIDGIYYNLDSTTYTAMVTNQQSSYYPAESYTDVVNIPSFITHNSQTYQVTTIGMFAFCGCSKLTSVTIPSSITTIGASAFSSCRVLTSVTIPNSVTTIGDYAFQVCDSLVSVAIGDSVTTIGLGAFKDCRKLSSIEIPNSVTTIGSYAFQNCSGLLFVKLSNSIKTIESSVFEGTSLTSIEIPNSVTTIGSSAFYKCSGLTSITIPNSVTTIGDYAFAYCSSLNSITIPNSVTTIGNYTFYGCKVLISVRINSDAICCKKYSYNANIKCIFGDQVKEYIVGDSVNTIGEYAFYDCKNMESVTIGKSVTSIESFAFSIINGNLQKTNYTGTIASWCKIKFNNGVTDNPIGTSGNLFINDVEIKDLVIPEGVDTIEDYAFCGCFGLNSIIIPSSVTTIGDNAFWCCFNLSSIICYATTPPICGISCYYIVSKSIPVYVPARSISAYKQANVWKDFTNILPIGDDPTRLENLTIDKKVGNKFIYGNQLYIRHNGNLYTATGAKVK